MAAAGGAARMIPPNPFWVIRTGRLVLSPVAPSDLVDLQSLKADPMVFAIMLGGVRSAIQASEELAADIAFWGAHGVGLWAVRRAADAAFLGLTGLHHRADGRGLALRIAFTTGAHGRGYASEAAGAALRFAHDRAGIDRVVAATRETNIGSRQVLGAIGMVPCETYDRDGVTILVYESRRD